MLSLDDIHHLDAAEGWLELGHWFDCFDALERIDPLHRSDAAVMALRWNLYNKARQHVIAADFHATTMGDSIGHCEGDTLVVDTAGFDGRRG